jgi:hypothetical protein
VDRGVEYRRRKRIARVPVSWFGLMPGQPLSFWVRVYWLARQKGVRKGDHGRIRDVAVSLLLRL